MRKSCRRLIIMEESKYRPYLEEFESSGLSIRKFCEGKNLCADGFYYFYKRHKEKAVVAVIKPKTDREMNDRLSIKTNVDDMTLEATITSLSELEMILEAMSNVQKRRKA